MESKGRIERVKPNRVRSSLDCELSWIKSYISTWQTKWCDSQLSPLARWRFTLISLQSLLVGLLRILKARSQANLPPEDLRSDLYSTAKSIAEGALALPDALHMLRPTSNLVFAATIIWQLSEPDHVDRDLVLRLGLRLAGKPGKEQVMLFARHNGLQIINMLWSVVKEGFVRAWN